MEKRLRDPALTRTIQDHIKEYIQEKHLAAGDRLPPEGQLALELGVGRGSVREAIKALESLGIIETRHGYGIYVRDFNFDSFLNLLTYGLEFDSTRIIEILQVRKWLETSAIDEVIQSIPQDLIGELEHVLDTWEKKAAGGQSTFEEDHAFHQRLYSVIGNRSLTAFLDIFWVVYYRNPRIFETPDDPDPVSVHEHRAILSAIRAKDAELARQRIQDHFRILEDRIEKVIPPPSPVKASTPPDPR